MYSPITVVRSGAGNRTPTGPATDQSDFTSEVPAVHNASRNEWAAIKKKPEDSWV